MEIREALYNDIDGIIDVNIATWFTAYRGIIKDETLQKRVARREKQIKNDKETYPVKIVDGEEATQIVAVENNKVIAFINFGKCREENKFNLKDAGEIYAFYVLQEYQGIGIGKKLFKRAINNLKEKYSQILIWCLKENKTVEFYKYMGAKAVLEREININSQTLDELGFVYEMLS